MDQIGKECKSGKKKFLSPINKNKICRFERYMTTVKLRIKLGVFMIDREDIIEFLNSKLSDIDILKIQKYLFMNI